MPANASINLRDKFWERYSLQDLSPTEWEALCDGCGTCCLIKLQDDQDEDHKEQIYYTSLSCQLLDCKTGHCGDYSNRKEYVPDCIQLNYDMLADIKWLPKTCAYRCLYEQRSLPSWHPLITGNNNSVIRAGASVAGRCQSEKNVHEDDVEDYLVRWVHV